ncbi:lipopolysaccharide biosynthesis protein [Geminicoccus roseus]|uniref:lipopolysaccharide biosynthesis protein n=1 Tax=Geminicoccus roseus TaxID=404900 RepID=UPI0003F4E2C7|nr:polysaccharide biosynthesis C-terminal domain-containing protein [Geminicoccus roseus]
MRRLVLDTAWVLASRLLMRGANVVALALLARALPIADFGFYGFLVATTLILSVALDLGLRQAGAYAIGQRGVPAGAVATTAMAFLAMAAPLGAMATWQACAMAGYDLSHQLLLSAAMVTPPQVVMRTLQGPLLGLKRVAELNVGELAVRAVLLLLTVPAFFQNMLDLETALLILVAAQWTGALVLVGQLLVRLRPLPLPSLALCRELVLGGLPFLAGIIGVILFSRVGIWAITAVDQPDLVGRYVGTLRMTEILAELATAVGVAVFAHGVQQDKSGRGAADTIRLVRLLTISMAGFAVVVGLAAPWLLGLVLGEAYVGQADALRLMLPGAVLGAQASMLFPGLSARGQARLGLLIFGPGSLIHGLLVWWLTPRLGVPGAAIGYTIGQAVVAAAVLFAWHRIFGTKLRDLLLPSAEDGRSLLRLVRRQRPS